MSIYGNNYINGFETLNILAITSILFTISLYLNRFNISNNKSWILFIGTSIGSLFMFLFLFLNLFQININILAWSFSVFYLSTILVYALRIKFC